MPGHVKKAKEGEVDPDPLPYLVVTIEMKRADMLLPYDPKNLYYCPDGKHGFMECILESNEGGKATVMCGHEVKNNQNSILKKGYFICKAKKWFVSIHQTKFFLTEKSL